LNFLFTYRLYKYLNKISNKKIMGQTTYADSGVNIELGNDVSKILYNAAKQTWENRKGRLGEIIVPFDDFTGILFKLHFYYYFNGK